MGDSVKKLLAILFYIDYNYFIIKTKGGERDVVK